MEISDALPLEAAYIHLPPSFVEIYLKATKVCCSNQENSHISAFENMQN